MNQLAPSILSADFSALGQEIRLLDQAGAHMVHIDVMDGHFAPNLTMGPALVSSIRPLSRLLFDVHLMLTHPLAFIKPFADAGADILTFHLECEDDITEVIQKIHSFGKKAGLALNPNTSIEKVLPYLNHLEMVLVMSVFPGFSGQKFMPQVLPKIQMLAQKKQELHLSYDIQVDGGINLENIKQVLDAGANIIVAASAIYAAEDKEKTIQQFILELGENK